jgi:chromosome segregation ATPase
MKATIIFGMLGISVLAFASIADDFKDASNRDGCEAIPYSSERSSCSSAGRDVDDWCKNSSRKWSCDDLDPSGLKRNIENVTSKIADLKKEKDDLDYKRNNSSDENERKDYEKKIEDKKAQIEELQKKVEAWTKQLADEKDMAGKRKDIGDQCVKNRIVVQKIFTDVKAKVQSETDPDAKQYVSRLVDKYTASEKGHQEAIDITNRGIEKCNGMK